MTEATAEPVVIDTNVCVAAAFNPASASARVVQSVRDGRLWMPWTDGTLREIRHVLQKIPTVSWDDFEDLFHPDARRSGPLEEGHLDWVTDPDDRKFAALARAASAVLVSNDRHLIERRAEASFTVLTPREYVDRITPTDQKRP